MAEQGSAYSPRINVLPLPRPGVYAFDASSRSGTFNGSFIDLSASMQELQTRLSIYSQDNTHIGSSLWVCASAVWSLAGIYVIFAVTNQARKRHILAWPALERKLHKDKIRHNTEQSSSRKSNQVRHCKDGYIENSSEKTQCSLTLEEPVDSGATLSMQNKFDSGGKGPSSFSDTIEDVDDGMIFASRAIRSFTLMEKLEAKSPASKSIMLRNPSEPQSDATLVTSLPFSAKPLYTRLSESTITWPSNLDRHSRSQSTQQASRARQSPSSKELPPFATGIFAANRPHVQASSRALPPPDDTGPASRYERQRRLEWSTKFPLYLAMCGIWMLPWSLAMHLYQAIIGNSMGGIACRLVGIGYFHSAILPLVLTMAVGIIVSIEAHTFRDLKLGWMDWRLLLAIILATLVLSLMPLAQGGYSETPHVCLAGGLGSRDYWLPLLNLGVWVVTAAVSITAYTYTLLEQKVYDSDREVTRRVMIYGTGCLIASAFQLPARIFLIINPNPETLAAEQEDLALQILSAMYPLITGLLLGSCFVFWDEKATGMEYRCRLSMSRMVRTGNREEKYEERPGFDGEGQMGRADQFGLDWHDDYESQSWHCSTLQHLEDDNLKTGDSRRSSTWSFHHCPTAMTKALVPSLESSHAGARSMLPVLTKSDFLQATDRSKFSALLPNPWPRF